MHIFRPRNFNRIVTSLTAVIVIAGFCGKASAQEDMKKIHDIKMKKLDGKEVELSHYKGKVMLVVNVASKCGLTPQYKQLQALHEKYADQGLAVVAFPCNQFGGQEPGTSDEIKEFCSSKYSVSFDMFEKVKVNGDDACDLYKTLTGTETKPAAKGKISWNFEKFLVDTEGKVVARFSPRTKPDDESVKKLIESQLANVKQEAAKE